MSSFQYNNNNPAGAAAAASTGNPNPRMNMSYNNNNTTTNNNINNTSVTNGTTDSLDGSFAGNNTQRRKQRAMSRVNIAATYSKEPARLRALTIAQQREDGDNKNVDDASILASAGIPWYQTVHKLHYVCAAFSVAAFVLGMVSFLTDHWHETRLGGARRYSGLFWQCGYVLDGCNTIDWHELSWTVHCIISSDTIKWIYYVNRGFIFGSIVACVVAFVIIMLSPQLYLSHMRAQSFAVMFCMICPVIAWSVAIGRWAAWQNGELYCGKSYCALQLEQTGSADCEESFGYSFILGILCLVLHVFGAVFSIARHIFGEWALEDVQGDDLAQTRRRVNVEYTVKRDRAQTLAIQKAEEEEERKRKEKEEAESASMMGSTRRNRGKSVITNFVPNAGTTAKNSRSVSQIHHTHEPTYNNNNINQQLPNNNTQNQNCQNEALNQFQMQIIAQQQNQNNNTQTQRYVANDWVFDPNSGLDWSESLYLFRDPGTQHLYDPNTGKWFDPVLQEWYQGE